MALTYWEYQLLVYGLAWIAASTPAFLELARRARGLAPRSDGWYGWRWWQIAGLALVLTPFVRMGIGVYYDVIALVQTTVSGGFVVLPAFSRAYLWSTAWRRMLYYLVIPGVGLLLMWNGRPRGRDLEHAGLAPRESAWRDALHGFALFFIIATAYVAAMVLAYGLLRNLILSTGDESQVWANITPALILLLSGVAGITEEFLFRGLLLSSLKRRMSFWSAALVQAVFFGLVHAGYMTWAHVLGPFFFGLGMAFVVRHLGLLPAIVLHAGVNVAFFSIDVADVQPQAWWLIAALAVMNLYAAYVTKLAALRTLWSGLFEWRRKTIPG